MSQAQENSYPFCPDETKYKKMVKIGNGTFGEVFKARVRETGTFVAMKKILMKDEEEGFPMTALREIKLLQVLKHENIVNLLEVCTGKAGPHEPSKTSVYLVFEFCEFDLAGLILNRNVQFNIAEIKIVLQQLLNGVYFIHANKVLHRDLKPSNVLITKSGVLKLADFGLARSISAHVTCYTNKVVTLWYRPPEIFLGEKNYGYAVDMWGVGCIMAEMWTRNPIMRGTSEQNQLTLITQMCGSITTEVWPDVKNLDLFNKIELPKGQSRKITHRLQRWINDKNALDLLDKLLTLDPSKRISANSALNHDFFWETPLPQDLGKTLSSYNTCMFELTSRVPFVPVQLQQRQQPRCAGATAATGTAACATDFNSDQHVERIF